MLQQTINTNDNRTLSVEASCLDSGGHHTQKVYEYCKNREHQSVYAIKGASQIGKLLVSKFSRNNKLRVKLFSIGTDKAKQMIYSRLKIHTPGAGYYHFPSDYPEENFKQLTAERIQTKFVNGHPARVWVLKKGKRNDALAQEQELERLKHKAEQQLETETGQANEWLGYEDWILTKR